MSINSQYPDARIATQETIEQLATYLSQANRIVAFTGAGISTESGIPDYRGPGGVWSRNAAPHIDQMKHDDQTRLDMWQFRKHHYPTMQARTPNAGHLAITRLHELGKLLAVITQNIDGLHQKSGIPDDRIFELHGSTHTLQCLNCGTRYEGAAIQLQLEAGETDPRCTVCGGPLRTGTVLFGESLPSEPLRNAATAAVSCDLMLVIGSSLVVYPAAQLPQLARQHGAALIILNRDPTPLDESANLVVAADAGDTLTRTMIILEQA